MNNRLPPLNIKIIIQFQVFNIDELHMKFVLMNRIESVQFPSHEDHSKWAVSMDPGGHRWVCIGDLNRTEGQLKRGGGTVCFQHPTIGDLFFDAAHRYDLFFNAVRHY